MAALSGGERWRAAAARAVLLPSELPTGPVCSAYLAQLYRPALCQHCFHTIAAHYEGEWVEEVEPGTGKTFFKNAKGEKLLASVSAVAAESSLALLRERSAVVAARIRSTTLTDTDLGSVANHVDAWVSFTSASKAVSSPGLTRPPSGMSSGGGGSSSSLLHPTSLKSGASVGFMSAGGLGVVPVEEEGEDEDDEDERTGPVSFPPKPVPSDTTVTFVPDAPSAVPQAALDALAINFSALSRRLEATSSTAALASFAPVPVDAVAPSLPAGEAGSGSGIPLSDSFQTTPRAQRTELEGVAEARAEEAAEGAGAHQPPPPLRPPAPLIDSGAGALPLPPFESAPLSPTMSEYELLGVESPRAPSAAAAAGAPTIDLRMHLGPVYEDPLSVNLASPTFSSDRGGVLVFRVAQPHEEDFTVPRYLLVTPFTVLALAPHPGRPGMGVLKWERSILSLTGLVSQPLFVAVPIDVRLGKGGSSVDSVFSGQAGGRPGIEPDDFILDRLPYGLQASSSTPGSRGAGELEGAAVKTGKTSLGTAILGTMRSIFRARGIQTSLSAPARTNARSAAASPVLGPVPTAGAPVRYKLSGVGLLASFAPESTDTMTLLRTYRAGKRPQALSGWLYKRKRQAWREHAPLGALAWKKRFFVLAHGMLTYHKSPGGEARGYVPLSGWVEVSRVGADATPVSALGDATSKPNAFLLRTGRTYHVFQASSSTEADAWVDAIAINAQHSSCALDEPQCLILPSHADALALARAVERRRADLVASLGATSAYGGTQDMLVDLTASQTIAEAAEAQREAMAAAYAYDNDVSPYGQPGQMPYGIGYRGSSASGGQFGQGGMGNHSALPPPLPRPRIVEPAAEGTISIAEADALVLAMGEASDEFLAQLPRSVQLALRAKHRPDTYEAAVQAFLRLDMEKAQEAADQEALRAAAWVYKDDSGSTQGPFPERAMRQWLLASFFTAQTLVHSVGGLLPEEMEGADSGGVRPIVDAAHVPTVFVPLATLFPDPNTAFEMTREWVPRYLQSTAYQAIYRAAMELGVDRHLALAAALMIKDNGLAPSLTLILDILSDEDLSGVLKAEAEARAAEEEPESSNGSSSSASAAHAQTWPPETPTAALTAGAGSRARTDRHGPYSSLAEVADNAPGIGAAPPARVI